MRKCYATALVLSAWYLMLPPPMFPPVQDASGNYKMNSTAPISQWLKLKTFSSEESCKAQMKKMQPYYKCIASYDTALKPATPPTTSTVTGAVGHVQ